MAQDWVNQLNANHSSQPAKTPVTPAKTTPVKSDWISQLNAAHTLTQATPSTPDWVADVNKKAPLLGPSPVVSPFEASKPYMIMKPNPLPQSFPQKGNFFQENEYKGPGSNYDIPKVPTVTPEGPYPVPLDMTANKIGGSTQQPAEPAPGPATISAAPKENLFQEVIGKIGSFIEPLTSSLLQNFSAIPENVKGGSDFPNVALIQNLQKKGESGQPLSASDIKLWKEEAKKVRDTVSATTGNALMLVPGTAEFNLFNGATKDVSPAVQKGIQYIFPELEAYAKANPGDYLVNQLYEHLKITNGTGKINPAVEDQLMKILSTRLEAAPVVPQTENLLTKGITEIPKVEPIPIPETPIIKPIVPEVTKPVIDPIIAEKIVTNLQHYKSFGGISIGKETPSAPLRDLNFYAETPTAKIITAEAVQNAIKKKEIVPNKDGTITAYRVGEISKLNDIVSATTDKNFAESFDRTGNAKISEIKVKPEEISYYIGGAENEILLHKSVIEPQLKAITEAQNGIVATPNEPEMTAVQKAIAEGKKARETKKVITDETITPQKVEKSIPQIRKSKSEKTVEYIPVEQRLQNKNTELQKELDIKGETYSGGMVKDRIENNNEELKNFGKEVSNKIHIGGKEINRGDFVQYSGRVMIFDSVRDNGKVLVSDPAQKDSYNLLLDKADLNIPTREYVESEYERIGQGENGWKKMTTHEKLLNKLSGNNPFAGKSSSEPKAEKIKRIKPESEEQRKLNVESRITKLTPEENTQIEKYFDLFKQAFEIRNNIKEQNYTEDYDAVEELAKKVRLTEDQKRFIETSITYMGPGYVEDIGKFTKYVVSREGMMEKMMDLRNLSSEEYFKKYPIFEPADFQEDKDLITSNGDWIVDTDGKLAQVTSGNDRWLETDNAKSQIGFLRSKEYGAKQDGIDYANQIRQATPEELKSVGIDPKEAKPDKWFEEKKQETQKKVELPKKQETIKATDLMKKMGIPVTNIEAIPSKTLDRFLNKEDNKNVTNKSNGQPNNNNSGSETRREKLPEAISVGKGQPRNAGEAVKVNSGEVAQRGQGNGGSVVGERSGEAITPKEQVAINKQVEDLLSRDKELTPAEYDLLEKYSGAGGLEKQGASGKGLLDEYYTPKKVVDLVWDKLKGLLPDNPKILEPAVGTGNFLKNAPKGSDVTAYETSPISAKITEKLYPEAKVKVAPFENIFVDERGNKKEFKAEYDLVIGNPPYGEHRGMYKGMGEEAQISRYEEYFIKRSLDLTKEGGYVAMVVPSGFLRGSSSPAKIKIAKIGELVSATRLPNGTFGTTDIGTDIVIFKKTPNRNGDITSIINDTYFDLNPDDIKGVEKLRKSRFGFEKYVEAKPETSITNKTLYHGTTADFEKFDENKAGANTNWNNAKFGTFFLDDPKRALDFAKENSPVGSGTPKVIEANVDIKNPLDLTIEGMFNKEKQAPVIVKILQGEDMSPKKALEYINENIGLGELGDLNDAIYGDIANKKLIQDAGYDGIVSTFGKDDNGNVIKEYVAFSPDQIKIVSKTENKLELAVVENETKYTPTEETKIEKVAEEVAPESSPSEQKEIVDGIKDDIESGEITNVKEFEKEYSKPVNPPSPVKLPTAQKGVTIKTPKKTGKVLDLAGYYKAPEIEKEIYKNITSTGEVDSNFVKMLSESDKEKYLNLNNGEWFTNFDYFSGDIYDKLDQLEKDFPTQNAQYKKQKAGLDDLIPERVTVDRMNIAPNTTFADMKIKYDGEEKTLKSAFISFLHTLPEAAFGQSSKYAIREYVNEQAVRGGDKIKNQADRETRRTMGNKLFSQFLKEGIEKDLQNEIVEAYNRKFNGYAKPDYSKVPLESKLHGTFKGKELNIKDVQRQGVGFLTNKGVAMLAHDVGLGKTMQIIIAVNETMKKGWAKKPLIVVPGGNVYGQWIKEIQELIPGVEINSLANLGGDFKGDLATLEIKDGAISIITYQGMQKLGFKDETYADLTKDLQDVIGDETTKKTSRGKELEKARLEETIGKGKKGTKSERFFEDLGFDLIAMDEAHNANHIIKGAKLAENGKSTEFRGLTVRPSDLGVKTWLATQYILKNNKGKNVYLASATPFTNNPMEYYSVLSLMARDRFNKMGIRNVNDFMNTFMDLTTEFEATADGKWKEKNNIRGFKNYQQFQKLLTEVIDFRDGEEAGVVRPERVPVKTVLKPTALQTQLIDEAQELFTPKFAKEGGTLKGIGEMKKTTFSPYASSYYKGAMPNYKEFVDNSPKIKSVMEMAKQVHRDNKEANQVIYSPLGLEFFPHIKEYLIKEGGFKPNEVAIIAGFVSKAKRVEIQEQFNAGKIKVILGSDAIQEGVNLQQKTTDLYVLSLPWNFTELKQVVGRVWRQGNEWKKVRIHDVYIENSVDVFLAQKLETKQKRYEAALKFKGDYLDVGDIDYEELKMDLIKSPLKRVEIQKSIEMKNLDKALGEAESNFGFYSRKAQQLNELRERIDRYEQQVTNYERYAKENPEESYYKEQIVQYKENVKEYTEKYDKEKAIAIDKGVLDPEKLKMFSDKIDEIKAKKRDLEANYESKLAKAKTEEENIKTEVVEQKNNYAEITQKLAEQNKTFFEKVEKERKLPPNMQSGKVSTSLLVGGLDKFIEQDLVPGAKAGMKGTAETWDMMKKTFVPASRGIYAKKAASITRVELAKKARMQEMLYQKLESARELFDKNSDEQNLEFIDNFEHGIGTDGDEKFAKIMREALDQRWAEVQKIKNIDTYIEFYFPHMWKDVKKATNTLTQFYGKRPLEGTKSYLKHRTIPYTLDGIALGLEPITYNPVELLMARIADMDRFIMAQKIWSQFKDEGLRKFVRIGQKAPDGWIQPNDKISKVFQFSESEGGIIYRGNWYMPEQAATILNNYVSPGLRGNHIYDAFRMMGNTMNQVNLGLSAFHAMFTSVDAVVSKTALEIQRATARGITLPQRAGHFGKAVVSPFMAPLHAWNNLIRGNKLLEDYYRDNPQIPELVDALILAGGRVKQDAFYRNNSARRFLKALRSGNLPGAVLRLPGTIIETAAKPIMDYLVPRQKLGVFADMAQFILEDAKNNGLTNEETINRLQEAWDSVDNRLGQMVYDNLFWNKTMKDAGMLATRSLGWNLGTVREIGGGLNDLASLPVKYIATGKTGPNGEKQYRKTADWSRMTTKMAYVFALPYVAAVFGAIIYYLYNGKGPEQLIDYYYPKTGRIKPDGTPDRISLPTYMKDIFAYWKQPTTTIANKLNPIWGTMIDMFENHDYYGTEIRNLNDPMVKQLQDELMFLAKQFAPYSITGALQEKATGGSIIQQAESFFGLMPAPGYITKTSIQIDISNVYDKRFGGTISTQDQSDAAQMKSKIRTAYFMGNQIMANKLLQQAVDKGYIKPAGVKLFIENSDIPPDVRMFKGLPQEDQAGLIKKMKLADLERYAWYLKNKELPNTEAVKQFVEAIKNNKIKEPKWNRGKNVAQ